MRPFKTKRESSRCGVRHVRRLKLCTAARLRESIGIVKPKSTLRASFLNVDGLNEITLEDVSGTIREKNQDIVFLLETKRRAEEIGIDISIPGYSFHEAKRSSLAGDKDGGGIVVYTKLADGLLFKRHTPDIKNAEDYFVNTERLWMTLESKKGKTAVCGVYLGCQSSTDKNGAWNDTIYRIIQQEAFSLRSKGYRILYLGDFNGHIGCQEGVGVPGNSPRINPNGRRFLDFLVATDSRHINGECRIPGRPETLITKGLWTRQRSGWSSIIDFGAISKEHLNSVVSMEVDDQGVFGGGSDHNWIFIILSDSFVIKKRISNLQVRKNQWNIQEDQDWSAFQEHVLGSVPSLDSSTTNNLASSISASILGALHATIGLRGPSVLKKPQTLPPDLVKEFRMQRLLETTWKSLNKAHANNTNDEVASAEQRFLEQKSKASDLLLLHRKNKRFTIIDKCSGNTPRARKNFWSFVSPNKKQSSEISAVIDPVTGVIKCDLVEIEAAVASHLTEVFQGSFDPIREPVVAPDHVYTKRPVLSTSRHIPDHTYSSNPSPCFPKYDSKASVETDPTGWLNCSFESHEVKSMLKLLQNNKARGWDLIPNEALKNLPDVMIHMITVLFNKIKKSGALPKGWNRGRITLVHKRGLREVLGNYRPITVLISLSGLYSRVLNARLSVAVEEHKILGETQNGFRKERCGSDNQFILDTVIWKSKAKRVPLHLSYLDISKAYDSVNRRILWKKLHAIGVQGEFLSCLKALYTDDCVDCEVNGLLTRPIYLRRGLRQGCSLSPLLFAIFISGVGNDLTLTKLGFNIGNVCISALLFADDLAVIARSGAGLRSLLQLVKLMFDELELTISCEKSQVVSPDSEPWDLLDSASNVVMSLKQVALYKYLGTWTYDSMYKTGVEKQRLCVQTANKYKGSCLFVSRMGPDVVDVVLCTWLNVAIPAILNGCDMIPFCETRILEIEMIQSQVAKFALGVSKTTSGSCAQSELGMKPFRQHLYERQLKFYFRVLYLPESRWVHQALLEHLSGVWASPYLDYISSVRSKLGLYKAPRTQGSWRRLVFDHFLNSSNNALAGLSCIRPLKRFARLPYVCESDWSTVISEFKLESEGLGNKHPRNGRPRKPLCPVCPVRLENSGFHLICCCSSLSKLRSETGISSFMNVCALKGFSALQAYELFVNGEDSSNKPVTMSAYLERGKSLHDMREYWFSLW